MAPNDDRFFFCRHGMGVRELVYIEGVVNHVAEFS